MKTLLNYGLPQNADFNQPSEVNYGNQDVELGNNIQQTTQSVVGKTLGQQQQGQAQPLEMQPAQQGWGSQK